MDGRYLLDTNIIIALFADEAAIKDRFAKAEEIFVASIVIGELCYGAWKSGRPQANMARIDEFAATNVVLGCDTKVAYQYGEIKESLRRKGRPLPENDIWIAAIALKHDLTLISRDGHFNEITNLKSENW